VTVDGGHRGGRLAGQVDQDGRGRAPVLGAVIDAGQHDQRSDRLQAEGDRQQHGDRRRRPDAGQHADRRTEHDADEAVEDVLSLQGRPQPEREVVEEIHLGA
jgi:hypothetical protein